MWRPSRSFVDDTEDAGRGTASASRAASKQGKSSATSGTAAGRANNDSDGGSTNTPPRFPRRAASARPRSRIETRTYLAATGTGTTTPPRRTAHSAKSQPVPLSRSASNTSAGSTAMASSDQQRPASSLALKSPANDDGSASPVSLTPFDTRAVFAPVSSGSEEETPVESGRKTHRTIKREKEREELVVQAIKEKYSRRPQRPASSLRALPPPPPLFDFSAVQDDTEEAGVLKGIPKTGTGQPMLWPSPFHVYYVKPVTADFYKPLPHLAQRMALHDRLRLQNPQDVMNSLVYDCIDPSPMHRSLPIGPLPPGQLRPYYIAQDENDTCLVFESRFESGNLRRAIRVYENEYDLILKPDTNTRGHTQWYYFKVSNTRSNRRYKFNVINMMKPDSLYNMGMQPLMYSEHASKSKGIGWFRGGTDVCYYQNHIKRGRGFYQTLTFSVTFEHDHDTVYFAYCYPYTYTDLVEYLKSLEADPKRANRFRRRPLCSTLAGNTCELLTVTSFTGDPEALRHRRGIVISARVHPGESNASWMMKGFIDYLTGSSMDAKILRDNFVFKIVPMLNPDGVIVGNYRCSLAGVDLNRQWIDPSKKLHPTVSNLKSMIKAFTEDRDVILYCDLHGHSRKQNIFMYGCESKPGTNDGYRLRERIFPRLLAQNGEFFSYVDCNFKVQKAKESTARVVVNRELGIINSYTMEASFCGANYGPLEGKHFDSTHFEKIGHYFCDTILDFCDPDQSKVRQVCRELDHLHPARNGEGGGIDSFISSTIELDLDRDSAGSDDDSSLGNANRSRPRGVSGKKRKDRRKAKKGDKKSGGKKEGTSTSASTATGTTTVRKRATNSSDTISKVKSRPSSSSRARSHVRAASASSTRSTKVTKVKKAKKKETVVDDLDAIASSMGYLAQDKDEARGWVDAIIPDEVPDVSPKDTSAKTSSAATGVTSDSEARRKPTTTSTATSTAGKTSATTSFASAKTAAGKGAMSKRESRGSLQQIMRDVNSQWESTIGGGGGGGNRQVDPSPHPTPPPRSGVRPGITATRPPMSPAQLAGTKTREALALEVLTALDRADRPAPRSKVSGTSSSAPVAMAENKIAKSNGRHASGSAVNATRQARKRTQSAKPRRTTSASTKGSSASIARAEVRGPTSTRPASSLGVRGSKKSSKTTGTKGKRASSSIASSTRGPSFDSYSSRFK